MEKTIKLSQPEIDQILSALENTRREGTYYGNKDQYNRRRMRIEIKLNNPK